MEGTEEDRVDDIHLDIENHLLTIAGNPSVRLTRLGLRLVQLLLARAGHVVRTERLYGHVWGARGGGDRELLKKLVHRLRRKIEGDPGNPRYLVTEAGIGYRLDAKGGGTAAAS